MDMVLTILPAVTRTQPDRDEELLVLLAVFMVKLLFPLPLVLLVKIQLALLVMVQLVLELIVIVLVLPAAGCDKEVGETVNDGVIVIVLKRTLTVVLLVIFVKETLLLRTG